MLHIVSETGSTNADLSDALRGGEYLPEGHWLLADRQNAGRGRLGRTWFDGNGNFMGSGIVRPGHGDPPVASLALVAGLAVHEALSGWLGRNADLRLKWPNDVLLDGAKISGVLLEGVAGAVIVGIGVNLVAAPDLPDRATTSLSVHGIDLSRDAFAQALVRNFAMELERWRLGGLAPLVRRWQGAAHPVGTPLRVIAPGEGVLEGTFAGLTEDGNLRLVIDDGSLRTIHAGDVDVLRQT